MHEDFLLVHTEYSKTPSGLILPNRTGKAVLALGLRAPQSELESASHQLGIEFEDNQGGIFLSPDFFTMSALIVAREHGWRPPEAP